MLSRTVQARADALAAIVRALEELELGDLEAAIAILRGVFEDGPAERRHRCRFCLAAFEWPGQRAHHEIVVHAIERAA
jgi:hypothetical protein